MGGGFRRSGFAGKPHEFVIGAVSASAVLDFRTRAPLRCKVRQDLKIKPECRSEEHTSELQSLTNLVCRLMLENKQETSDVNSLRVMEEGLCQLYRIIYI